MAKRGRKPTPTALKKLRGNPGKRKLPEDEPQPEVARPAPPELVTRNANALQEWNRIVPQLEALQLVSKLDRAALAAYCMAWATWVEHRQLAADEGEVLTTERGYKYVHPSLGVANRALAQLQALVAEFGLSPSARTRVKGAAAVDNPDTPGGRLRKFRQSKPRAKTKQA